jgi:hypothetical protein
VCIECVRGFGALAGGLRQQNDIVVLYGPDGHAAGSLPPICPKCGSHRTQIVGRLEDGKTLILRCNACGALSTLLPNGFEADTNDSLMPAREVTRRAQ